MFAGERVLIVDFLQAAVGSGDESAAPDRACPRAGERRAGPAVAAGGALWAGSLGPRGLGSQGTGQSGGTEGTGDRRTLGTGSVALGPCGAAAAAGDMQYLWPVTELPTLVVPGSAGLLGPFELSLGVREGVVGPNARSQAPVLLGPPGTREEPLPPCGGLPLPGWGLEDLGPTSSSEFRAREPCSVSEPQCPRV